MKTTMMLIRIVFCLTFIFCKFLFYFINKYFLWFRKKLYRLCFAVSHALCWVKKVAFPWWMNMKNSKSKNIISFNVSFFLEDFSIGVFGDPLHVTFKNDVGRRSFTLSMKSLKFLRKVPEKRRIVNFKHLPSALN